jgi:hypothetical protein
MGRQQNSTTHRTDLVSGTSYTLDRRGYRKWRLDENDHIQAADIDPQL